MRRCLKPLSWKQILLNLPLWLVFAFPASTNYRLNEWTIGGGGSERSASGNYLTETVVDSTLGDPGRSSGYQIGPGQFFVQMANVPPAPTIANENDWYNKLKLTINNGDNPSHATFAVAISSDNFITTSYVKADNTVGSTLEAADWRTFDSWGGVDGVMVIGLQADTTYSFKVKSERGDFTESPWGPIATGETVPPSLVFDIDVAATDIETDSPYIVSLGDLQADAVTTATDKIWLDFGTNAEGGGVVFIAGSNNGLKSNQTNHTIPGVTADLSGQEEGYGLQTTSITQAAGGPFTADSPFDGAGTAVGATGTALIPLNTSLAPLTDGRSSQDVMTTISAMTPASNDYTEVLSLVACATF